MVETLFSQEIASHCSQPGDEPQEIKLEVLDSDFYHVNNKELVLSLSQPQGGVTVEVQKLDKPTDSWQDETVGQFSLRLSLKEIKVNGKRRYPGVCKELPIRIISPYAQPFSDPPATSSPYYRPIKRRAVIDRLRRHIERLHQDEARTILWLYGVPQCGKTTLLKALTDAQYGLKTIVPVHVLLEDRKRTQEVRNWKVMHWIDQEIAERFGLSLKAEFEYSVDLYLMWSNALYNEVLRHLTEQNATLLLMLDGAYSFGRNRDIYRTLVGLLERLAIPSDLDRKSKIKVLITDVISFQERITRLGQWRSRDGEQMADLLRGWEKRVTEFPAPLLSPNEVYALLRQPFADSFPAYKLHAKDSILTTLRNQTAGHLALLKAVFHTSPWLYTTGAEVGTFNWPSDACRHLADLYEKFEVLDDDEKRCVDELRRTPGRVHSREDLGQRLSRSLMEKGVIVAVEPEDVMVAHWYAMARS